MSNAGERLSVRDVSGTIRHLDATRARDLVEAFRRPFVPDGHSGAEAGDEVVADAYGQVTLGCGAAHGVSPQVLGSWKTRLHLHGLLRIPLSVARELAKHPGDLYLDKVATITDSVAHVLGEHAGGCLSLDNLRTISPRAATALGRHAGDLSLNGLVRLPVKVALGLFQHSAVLHLDGLTALEPLPAAAICRHRGHLHLNGLTLLSSRVSSHLSQYRGRLHLHGVALLSDEAAAAFGSRTGHLCLPGVARLSRRQAELLAGHHGELQLGRVKLDDATADALGRHRGSLFIRVSNDVSDRHLEALIRHQGPLEISGLTTLDEARARILASQTGPNGARGLSCLFIDTVRRLTPAVATILASHAGGGLCLTSIEELEPDVARALVKHPILCLDVLARVSDEVAAILATHTGSTLSLRGLRDVSPRALSILKATPSVELPPRLASPQAVQAPSRSESRRPAAGPGLRGTDLLRLLRRIARQGDIVMRRTVSREDDAP